MNDVSDRSLRERKKAKTQALIQTVALRLFKKQGYEATTIEQIAEEAEVSPSTVFRYFPTKPGLVVYDVFDESLIELFRSQPAELNVMQAIRNVIRAQFDLASKTDENVAFTYERARLMREVPELRGAMFDEMTRSLMELKDLISERSNHVIDADDILILSGAIFGVVWAAWLGSPDDNWEQNLKERTEKGLDLLEFGFRNLT